MKSNNIPHSILLVSTLLTNYLDVLRKMDDLLLAFRTKSQSEHTNCKNSVASSLFVWKPYIGKFYQNTWKRSNFG